MANAKIIVYDRDKKMVLVATGSIEGKRFSAVSTKNVIRLSRDWMDKSIDTCAVQLSGEEKVHTRKVTTISKGMTISGTLSVDVDYMGRKITEGKKKK